MNDAPVYSCKVCGRSIAPAEAVAGTAVRDSIAELIRQALPDWSPRDFICLKDLNYFQAKYVNDALELEKRDLSNLEADVKQSSSDYDCMARNINLDFEKQLTMGERMADAVAAFGGSWFFIILFSCIMVVWIAINSFLLLRSPFDPYPYILLNLVLSCLSSLQGPIILMSQNRQDAKDRMRSEYDYRVNLKAELEIRHLNSKMDMLVKRQWQRLMEIQEIQLELMQIYRCECLQQDTKSD